MLKEYFMIPSAFGISRYHELVFDFERKEFVEAILLSNSRNVDRLFLLKKAKVENALRKNWAVDLGDESLRVSIPELFALPSKQHRSRKGYLNHNILQQYYKDDEQMNIACFEDGTKGLDERSSI